MTLAILGSFFTACFLTILSIPTIIKISELKNLNDNPSPRKLHSVSTPTLGGVAIFAAFIISSTLWLNPETSINLQYIICALIILFFIGIKDDIYDIIHYKKFIVQAFASFVIIHFAGIKLTSLYGLFGVYEISTFWSYVLSFFVYTGIINAINLIDGINCLAGSIGMISSVAFGAFFYYLGLENWSILCFALTGSLAGFLYFNKTPAKIFMGDTGSLIVGLMCSIFAIHFIEYNADAVIFKSGPTIAISILIIPIFDTIRIILRRLWNKKGIFQPDRNHIHHILVDSGFSHHKSVFFLLSVNLFVIGSCYIFQDLDKYKIFAGHGAELLLFFIFIFMFLLFNLIERSLVKKVK